MRAQRVIAALTASLCYALAPASCAPGPGPASRTDSALATAETKDDGDPGSDPDVGAGIGSEPPSTNPTSEPPAGDPRSDTGGEQPPMPEGSIALDICVAAGKAGLEARRAFCNSALVSPEKKQPCWSRVLQSRGEWIGWCYWNFQVGFAAMATTGKLRVANPIAERRLAVAGEPGREIVVTLGKPRPSRKLSAWACSFSIEGIPDVRRRTAYGGDSLQALQMAIEGARVVIGASGLVCTLEGGEPGEIGLPRPVPTFEGSDFAKKIERYIDREMKKFMRAAKAQRDARARRPRRIG